MIQRDNFETRAPFYRQNSKQDFAVLRMEQDVGCEFLSDQGHAAACILLKFHTFGHHQGNAPSLAYRTAMIDCN